MLVRLEKKSECSEFKTLDSHKNEVENICTGVFNTILSFFFFLHLRSRPCRIWEVVYDSGKEFKISESARSSITAVWIHNEVTVNSPISKL